MRALARRIYRAVVPARTRFRVRERLSGSLVVHDAEGSRAHLLLLSSITSRNPRAVDFTELLRNVRRVGVLAPRPDDTSDWRSLGALFSAHDVVFPGEPAWGDAQMYFVIGIGRQYSRELERIKAAGRPCFVIEESFLRSVAPIGLHWLSGIPAHACAAVAYVLDARAPAFQFEVPTQLEHDLNSQVDPSPADLARARALIGRIVGDQLSKYNCQPIGEVLPLGHAPRVLVVDQAYQDYAVALSGGDDRAFARMLEQAIDENPGAQVLVKLHVERGGRPTYFSRLRIPPDVTIVSTPTNPIALLQAVDKVYTYSSTMGWEALMCGREVHVFGAPIYAGWGLTHDRRDFSGRRARPRSVAELFFFIYLRASRYVDPASGRPCTIERALEYLVEGRAAFLRAFPAGPPASRR